MEPLPAQRLRSLPRHWCVAIDSQGTRRPGPAGAPLTANLAYEEH
jgi:hypothetical protein